MKTPFCVYIGLLVSLTVGSASSQNLLNGPQGVVYDSVSHRMLLTNFTDGAIVQVDSNHQQSYFQTGLGNCMYSLIHGTVLYVSGTSGIRGFSLTSGEVVLTVTVPGMVRFAGIAVDTSGYLYTVDSYTRMLHRIDLTTQASSTLISTGLPFFPEALYYDAARNRLLLTSDLQQPTLSTPIISIDLNSAALDTVAMLPFGWCEGITRDRYGYWYVTDWNYGRVWFMDSVFSKPPRLLASGYRGPTGLTYDHHHRRLLIPNFLANRVDSLSLPDSDSDGVPDFDDNCPLSSNPNQEDGDADAVGDSCDNCPAFYNPGQENSDADSLGNSCDPCPLDPDNDADNDGLCADSDNCPEDYNPLQEDADGNGSGDACCCVLRVGDVNSQGEFPDEVTLGDIMLLVDVKFVSGDCTRLACLAEADVNQDGGTDPTCDDNVTLGDIMTLVDFLFISGPENATLANCL